MNSISAARRPAVANLPPDEAAYAFQPASESPEFSLEDKLLMLLRLRGWALVSTVRTLRPRMLRTMWFALSCLAVLGAMITIKVATTPAPLAVAATHDQTAIGIAFGPNTAAKSDRLPIPDIRKPTEADLVPPAATTMPVEAPSSSLETTNKAINETTRKTIDTTPNKIAHRRWQDSNAKLIADSPPRRHPKARSEKANADNDHGKSTSNVFRCRQDAFGNLLRSLDVSPHCSS